MKKIQDLVAVVECGICGEQYDEKISYCDETFDCACDMGESLITL
jgi:hypothetical protein